MSGFDDLHAQFTAKVRAMAPEAPATPAPHRTARWRQHPLVVAIVALGVTASAAGAVVLATHTSAPVSGTLPPSVVQDGRGATGYRFTVRPQLAIGSVGWCTITTFTGSGPGPHGGGSACGRARRSDESVLSAGFDSMYDRPGDPSSERRFVYAIVDRTITAARRADGTVITPRVSREVPAGWKSILIPQRGAGGLTYLGRDGRPVPQLTDTEQGARDFPLQRFRDVSATALARRTWCALEVDPGSSVRIRRARTLRDPPAATANLNGRAFLSCTTASVTLGGSTYTAAVLVDAGDPGSRPATLPGAAADADGTVRLAATATTPAMTARRGRGSWLVVQGGRDGDRGTVLRALTGNARATSSR